MSDESDVRNALVFLADAVLPPFRANGTVNLFAGWPNEQSLDADLAAGVDNVSVFPDPRMQRNVTRFNDPNLSGPQVVTPTMTAAVSGSGVVFAGQPQAGQVVGIITSASRSQTYQVKATDSTGDVAAGVAAAAGGVANGSGVTFPGVARLVVRVGGPGSTVYEGARIFQVFRVTVWSFTPQKRDALGSALMQQLAGMQWLTLSDQRARMRFVSESTQDGGQKLSLYRKDILLSVEYATTTVVAGESMIMPGVTTAQMGTTYG